MKNAPNQERFFYFKFFRKTS